MSAVLEPEVSAGYPTDGQIFEPPQQSRDNEEPRYVTILGSFVTPIEVAERWWETGGGIQITNPCLKFVKNFIRKGRISPVLKNTHDWCSVDYWEKATAKDASYFVRQIPAGYVPPLNEYGNPSKIAPMMGKLAYPGEQIDHIVNGSANVFKRSRRGVVELKTLRGQPYNPVDLGNGVICDPDIWRLQKAIFPQAISPTNLNLPVLFDELEQLLDAAAIHSSLRTVVDEMQVSLNQARDYARATVEETHYNMRESAQKSAVGYIPRYTDLDFVLLEQLGMARQDIAIRKDKPQPAPNSKLETMFEQWLALQIEEKQAIAAERAAQVTDTPMNVDVNTMAAAPIVTQAVVNSKPEPIKELLPCNCGDYTGTTAGLRMHKQFHCKLSTVKDEPVSE